MAEIAFVVPTAEEVPNDEDGVHVDKLMILVLQLLLLVLFGVPKLRFAVL